jgi:replicative DNA helicase
MAKKKATRQTEPYDEPERMRQGREGASEATDAGVPVNRIAEQAVLGSMMLKPDVIDDAVMLLTHEDFWDEAHREIFAQLVAMHGEGKKFDVILLGNRLKAAKMLDMCGGAAYLAEMALAVPTASNLRFYAGIVREYAQRRRLMMVGYDCVSRAGDLGAPFPDSLAEAERGMLAIAEKEAGEQHTRPLGDVLMDAMAAMDARKAGEIVGQTSGYSALDDILGGFRPGDMVILAGRPSMGKTAFGLNLSLRAATAAGIPVLFMSLEMSALLVAERLAAAHSKVSMHRMQSGSASPEMRREYVEACSALASSPLSIDDCPSRTMSEIGALARRQKRKNGLGLLVIDYLQLVVPENPRDNRQDQVALMSRRVKALARELEVPVVCIAQLNREAAKNSDTRPRLHHLRESGAIEQDADTVLLIHRESYYSNQQPKDGEGDPSELIVAKQRNGPTGTVKLLWFSASQRFEPASKRDEWEQGTYFEGEAETEQQTERRERQERQTHY